MDDPNQQDNSSEPATLPAKRKRGRPRKDDVPGSEASARTQRQSPNPNPTSERGVLGQRVTGRIDGVFDTGFLISVRAGNSGPPLRGMVFDKQRSVPISNENDIAPHIKMSKSDDFPIPISVEPLQRRDPSVPLPVTTNTVPNDGGQGSGLVSKDSEATAPPANLSTVQVSDQGEELTVEPLQRRDPSVPPPVTTSTVPNDGGQGSGLVSKDSEATVPAANLSTVQVSDQGEGRTVPNDGGQGSSLVPKYSEATVPAANLSTVQVSDQGEELTDVSKLDSTGQMSPRSHVMPFGDKSEDGDGGADGKSEENYDSAATEAPALASDVNSV